RGCPRGRTSSGTGPGGRSGPTRAGIETSRRAGACTPGRGGGRGGEGRSQRGTRDHPDDAAHEDLEARVVLVAPTRPPDRTLTMNIALSRDNWIERTLAGLEYSGFAIVEGVLDDGLIADTREALYAVRCRILADVGEERLARASELGVLRLMLEYEPHFF